MESNWEKLNVWLAKNAPQIKSSLNPPATAKQIKDTENILGISFPEDFKQSYLIHNGQESHAEGLIDGCELLSLDRIIDEWNVWKGLSDSGEFSEYKSEAEPPVKDDWWNEKWIPYTYNGAGDHLCIDMDPIETGRHGQVISRWHDMPERNLLGTSFLDWFSSYIRDVENGIYTYSSEYGGIVKNEDF